MSSGKIGNVAIVGAGRMGWIRARSIGRDDRCRVAVVVDSQEERAQKLSGECGCPYSTDWQQVVNRPEIDAVVVSVTHNLLSPISTAALAAGKHVFCEKPMARTVAEAEAVVAAVHASGCVFRLGCTLRHHPAVQTAHLLLGEGRIGQPLYLRAVYGHGGRPFYDQEWRMVRELGGGGELLDQGIHLIDLSRWFLGDFSLAKGMIGTYFWTRTAHLDPPVLERFSTDLTGPVEDNAFLLLRNAKGQTASLHASWTQWKNEFRMEIFGREGMLAICGLGGSYGEEKLVHYRRRPEGGIPEILPIATASPEGVWDDEWLAFSRALPGENGWASGQLSTESATAEDGLEAVRIVCSIYEDART